MIEEITLELIRVFRCQPVSLSTTGARYLERWRAMPAIERWSSVSRVEIVNLTGNHRLPS